MLKGWKRWAAAIISVAILGSLLAAIIICCVQGARLLLRGLPFVALTIQNLRERFGRRDYQKVETEEDICLDIRGREDFRYREIA